MISSGCGTGKSHFVTNHLREHFPDVSPRDIIIVTSRSLTADQQSRTDGCCRYWPSDKEIVNYWNGDRRGDEVADEDGDIHIMTYDKFIFILLHCNCNEHETLNRVKIVVFDECHTIFSDTFITNYGMVQLWIRERLRDRSKIIFGLTATPTILLNNAAQWGVVVNKLNDEVLMRHKAKQMTCTSVYNLPQMIRSGMLPGKTLIVCHSYALCKELQRKIPRSAIIVGHNHEAWSDEVSRIRDFISKNAKFPDMHFVEFGSDNDGIVPPGAHRKDSGYWEPLEVLLATTTAREGYNLIEESGVQNIVSCLADEMNTVQIVGRARYDLDNVVVALASDQAYDKQHPDEYLPICRKRFKEFMNGQNDGREWFETVSHVVEHGFDDLRILRVFSDIQGFKQYLDDEWVSIDTERRIYTAKDKNKLIAKCVEYKVTELPKSKVSWQKVLKLIEGLGYHVESGRVLVNGKRVTCKIIRPAIGDVA